MTRAKKAYQVTRTHPQWGEKTTSPVGRKRDAAASVFYTLHDGANLSKTDASRFASSVEDAPLGTTVTHEPSGYTFRIDQVSA